jgi:hypothetical protein
VRRDATEHARNVRLDRAVAAEKKVPAFFGLGLELVPAILTGARDGRK